VTGIDAMSHYFLFLQVTRFVDNRGEEKDGPRSRSSEFKVQIQFMWIQVMAICRILDFNSMLVNLTFGLWIQDHNNFRERTKL